MTFRPTPFPPFYACYRCGFESGSRGGQPGFLDASDRFVCPGCVGDLGACAVCGKPPLAGEALWPCLGCDRATCDDCGHEILREADFCDWQCSACDAELDREFARRAS